MALTAAAACRHTDMFYVQKGKRHPAVLVKAHCQMQAYQATFADVYTALKVELDTTMF